MEAMSLAWIAEAIGAQIVGAANGSALSISTDTRRDVRGSLFFALQGENADGHRYVARAFAKGAAAAVVCRLPEEIQGTLLLVPDTLLALGDLAIHYRRRFSIPVIGVTGSVGKTSTKEMISAVLRTRYPTLATEKNHNNEMGVPLAICELTRCHQAAVIEMGMRGAGQIDRLAEIAQPSIGVITNIGFSHIELLGSRHGIAQAKAELLARLPEDGVAILPQDPGGDADSPGLLAYLKSCVPQSCRIVTYGSGASADADISLIPGHALPGGGTEGMAILPCGEYPYSLPVIGRHHSRNAGAALAVAIALGIPPPRAIEALGAWRGAEGRMTPRPGTLEGVTILDDCYNAGPESMASALETLAGYAAGHRVAVLGDMRELGDFAPEAHRMIGEKAANASLRLLVTVGDMGAAIGEEAARRIQAARAPEPAIRHFADSRSAADALPSLLERGDAVLVKGSHAMQMKQIVTALIEERGGGSHEHD